MCVKEKEGGREGGRRQGGNTNLWVYSFSLQNHPIWSTLFLLCFKVLDLGNFPQ